MHLKFNIERTKFSENRGKFKKQEVDAYLLTASFTPDENESRIFVQHPLFKQLIFMEYNEIDKWVTGLIFKEINQQDRVKYITVNSIFANSDYVFRAYSIRRILELRSLVIEAVKRFVTTVDILEKLEGTEEFNITIDSLQKE